MGARGDNQKQKRIQTMQIRKLNVIWTGCYRSVGECGALTEGAGRFVLPLEKNYFRSLLQALPKQSEYLNVKSISKWKLLKDLEYPFYPGVGWNFLSQKKRFYYTKSRA